MKLDLLAIAAHPDDVELTCGGTLLKAAEQGYKTGILDLTAGEMGTRGTPETRLKESAKAARRFCAWRTAKICACRTRIWKCHEGNKLAVARRIRALKPHTVILPYWEGRHPDHYTAARLGYEGCFLAGLKQLPIEGEAFRPFKILYSTVYFREVRPTFVVDISRYFERRYKAILAYHSQFNPKAEGQEIESGYSAGPPAPRGESDRSLLRANGRRGICRAVSGEGSDAGGRRGEAAGAVDLAWRNCASALRCSWAIV